MVARRQARLDELKQSLAGATGEILTLAADVTEPVAQRAAIERAKDAFGGLDFVVNNAGVGAMGRFEEASPERLRQVMEVNFFAAAELTRDAVPLLKQGRHPIVVNVSSVLGHRGVPGYAEYCASKFALEGFSQSLRAELAPQGIDVLVVSPARTRTEFFEQAIGAEATPWPLIKGMTSETVARRIVHAMRRGKHQLIISLGGKALVWVSRLLPGIVDRILARHG